MVDISRYISKFTSIDGSVVAEMPLAEYEWQSSSDIRTSEAVRIGLDFAHDFHGYAPPPVGVASERLRFLFDESDVLATLEESVGLFIARCYNIGRGYLYMGHSNSLEYRAEARLNSLPSLTIASGRGVQIPIVVEFKRFTWWQATSAVTEIVPVTASPTVEELNIQGMIGVRTPIIRIKANANGTPLDQITIVNARNGLQFSLDIAFTSIDEEVKIDCNTHQVWYSDDDGATYSDAGPILTLPDTQTAIFGVEPGLNEITITAGGTPNVDVEFEYVPLFI